jgi:hypothetical protein
MQKITAILFAAIIAVVIVPMATAYAQQPNATITSCLDIAVTLIYLDSVHATLNEAEIAPNRTILLENVNNLFTNLPYDCPDLNQGLTDYLDFGDFTHDQP